MACYLLDWRADDLNRLKTFRAMAENGAVTYHLMDMAPASISSRKLYCIAPIISGCITEAIRGSRPASRGLSFAQKIFCRYQGSIRLSFQICHRTESSQTNPLRLKK